MDEAVTIENVTFSNVDDPSHYARRLTGLKFIAQVPDKLGACTKLDIINNRVVCRTESGITLILPRPK